jgi:hypothetical protein
LKVSTAFLEGGPILPLEFSRISGDRRLTLVIDQTHGIPCPTLYAESSESSLEAAIENLRMREGTNLRGIGCAVTITETISASSIARHKDSAERILEWAKSNNFDATIWTALNSNFQERSAQNAPFSVSAAVNHVCSLDDAPKDAALNYIRKAPACVETPFRKAIESMTY